MVRQPLFSTPVYILGTASAGVTTGTGTGIAVNHSGSRIEAILKWSSGCSAGTVVLEGADSYNYSGTWQNIDTFPWTAASKVDIRSYEESFPAVRFRVTSNIVGGTITARVQAYA